MKIIKLLILLLIINTAEAPELIGASFKCRQAKLVEQENTRHKIYILENSDFSIENLTLYLHLLNITNDVIIKQAILESGWFNSSLFKEGNNLFGMKLPLKRKTLANGTYLAHARYNHWTDSVKDYLLWLEYYKSIGYDTTNYYKFLKDVGYATNPNYIKLLKTIIV